jgi:hypothetical protein
MSQSNEDELVRIAPELLPFNKEGDAVFNWLPALGEIDAALIYARLFWPNFRSLCGSVFLRPVDQALYERWMTELKQDKRRVEKMLNHTHLADLFCNSESLVTAEKLLSLGRILMETWTQKLKLDFPARKFEVTLDGGGSPDPVDVTVTLSEVAD